MANKTRPAPEGAMTTTAPAPPSLTVADALADPVAVAAQLDAIRAQIAEAEVREAMAPSAQAMATAKADVEFLRRREREAEGALVESQQMDRQRAAETLMGYAAAAAEVFAAARDRLVPAAREVRSAYADYEATLRDYELRRSLASVALQEAGAMPQEARWRVAEIEQPPLDARPLRWLAAGEGFPWDRWPAMTS
jgi:hypothetical protein